jgi:predicted regulator of Ras-like GTPase activity (Roadblock/LC7/MglB family)
MREGQQRGPHHPSSQTDTPVATIIDSLAHADGLTTSSAGFKNGAAETVAEQAIDIVRVCHSLALRLGAGACINTMIEGHQGRMMAVMIDDRVLVALARPGVAIAPAVLAMREAARRLRELSQG